MVAAMGMSSGDIVGGSGEEEATDVGSGGGGGGSGRERRGSQQGCTTTVSSVSATNTTATSFPVTQALVSLLAANSSLIHLAGKGSSWSVCEYCTYNI